jgi:hypothetical protein
MTDVMLAPGLTSIACSCCRPGSDRANNSDRAGLLLVQGLGAKSFRRWEVVSISKEEHCLVQTHLAPPHCTNFLRGTDGPRPCTPTSISGQRRGGTSTGYRGKEPMQMKRKRAPRKDETKQSRNPQQSSSRGVHPEPVERRKGGGVGPKKKG